MAKLIKLLYGKKKIMYNIYNQLKILIIKYPNQLTKDIYITTSSKVASLERKSFVTSFIKLEKINV